MSFRANAELQEQRESPRQATNQIDAEYSGPKSKPNVANDSGKDGVNSEGTNYCTEKFAKFAV